ncbi:hypothetical protein RGU70_13600 [Herbaspirillum sp. RTI4]|uniref:hyaluronate lyase N-terminal domain-containing protein n=1 Tax=Herbaspirillum sp. RTI4 TaxID=3048640 RepID=UPI002AB53228|nr:hypothetical protein [Herbaspirillum sp. RTI4]MDY7579348.1 hypothetical protein [Herbaspirillum sp. RTI4]MEA9980262.1 hypothetical protein [Herbaspirillum sp. RTI4]
MSSALKLRRDTSANIAVATGAAGEVFVDTTKNTLVVNDGATTGGFPLARVSDVQTGLLNTATTGGTVNALTATLPTVNATALTNGQQIMLISSGANTSNAALVLTLGATVQASKSILKGSGQQLAPGDTGTAGYPMGLVYSATLNAYVLLNPATAVSVGSQWLASGLTPTYISANSFSLTGNQATEFHVGRRLQFTTTAGMVYGSIVTSVFGALTTVTMQMDLSQVLDSGLSVANLSILRADHSGVPVGDVPIRSVVVSSSTAFLDFTLDNATYESFELFYTCIIPVATSDTLSFRAAVAGVVQSTAVYTHANYAFLNTASNPGGVTGDSLIYLTPGGIVNNLATGGGTTGSFKLLGAASTTNNKVLTHQGNYFNTGGNFGGTLGFGEVSIPAAALSGFRLFFAAGNIASGTFTLYGKKRAF